MPYKEVPIIQKCLGLHVGLPKYSFGYLYQNESTFLTEAVNVEIGNNFVVSRRLGYEVVIPGSVSNVVSNGELLYFVLDGVICCYDGSVVTPVVQVGIQDTPLLPYGKLIYYGNVSDRGIIDGTSVTSFSGVGKAETIYGGRVYHSSGGTVVFTNPTSPGLIDSSTNYIHLGSDVLFVRSFANGIVVGLSDKVIRFLGPGPDSFRVTEVLDEKVISGTAIETPYCEVDGKKVTGKSVLLTTVNGAYAVTPDGNIFSLTEDRLKLPCTAESGSAWFCDGKYHVNVN